MQRKLILLTSLVLITLDILTLILAASVAYTKTGLLDVFRIGLILGLSILVYTQKNTLSKVSLSIFLFISAAAHFVSGLSFIVIKYYVPTQFGASILLLALVYLLAGVFIYRQDLEAK